MGQAPERRTPGSIALMPLEWLVRVLMTIMSLAAYAYVYASEKLKDPR